MKKKVRHDIFSDCTDPRIADSLKQGDIVRVTKELKGVPITVDFIVRYYEQEDSYNGNYLVKAFTMQLNKSLGKPKGWMLEETLIFNSSNMHIFKFCSLAHKRWGMRKIGMKHNSQLTENQTN